ncbi:MAG: hypothetical protein R2813_03005 [Flavobacteriales bacterium]
MKKKILYIMCISHSGSTVLGNIIGSHTRAIHLGQIGTACMRKDRRVCHVCQENECPVWDKTFNDEFLDGINASYQQYQLDQLSLIGRLKSVFRQYRSAEVYSKVFDNPMLDFDIMVDSTKSIPWSRFNALNRDYEYFYLFLYRDLRAIWASKQRKFGKERHGESYLKTLKAWVHPIIKFSQTIPETHKLSLNYEALIKEPRIHLSRITDLLGVGFENTMMDYELKVHHISSGNQTVTEQNKKGLGLKQNLTNLEVGNRDFYAKKASGLVLDERWKSELSDADLHTFDVLLKETNAKIGYPD